jgi:hypothetical protein
VTLKAKPGVLVYESELTSYFLATADRRNDTITSGAEGNPDDGVHSPNSLHYDGFAWDVRWRRTPRARAVQVRSYRRAGFNTISEADHLHVSFDPDGKRR